MEPSLNVKRLFGLNRGFEWPRVNRGNAIERVQKILENTHVAGIPNHWPRIYYGQTRANLNENRTFRNKNVHNLPSDGVYLYLIEYDPATNRYHKIFVRVLNKLESGSRHFQMPSLHPGRVIVAAGELSKQGPIVFFNLESGTYTRNLMKKTVGRGMTHGQYIELVKNALRTGNYTPEILIPNIKASLTNLLKRGNLSFYYGNASEKSRQRVMRELTAAGLTTNSARNLISKLIEKTSPVSVKRSRSSPSPLKNAANAPQPHRRSLRQAQRV